MTTKDMTIIAAALFHVALAIAAIYGWVCNIIAIAATDTFSGLVVVRIIGVFLAPIGAVLGYI